MTEISRRLEQVVHKELTKTLLPVKTAEGIRVGESLIVSEDSIKHIWLRDRLVYKEVSLNVTAIKLANLLAKDLKSSTRSDAIYKADQDYGLSFTKTQLLRQQYHRAVRNNNEIKADVLWVKYCESRDKTAIAKKHVEALAMF